MKRTTVRRTDIKHPATKIMLSISAALLGLMVALTIGCMGLIKFLDYAEEHRDDGNYNSAYHPSMEDAEAISKNYPNSAESHFAMCLVRYDAGDYDASASEARKVLTYPDKEDQDFARIWLAKCYQRQGKIEEARKLWQTVVSHYPPTDTGWYRPLTVANRELGFSR